MFLQGVNGSCCVVHQHPLVKNAYYKNAPSKGASEFTIIHDYKSSKLGRIPAYSNGFYPWHLVVLAIGIPQVQVVSLAGVSAIRVVIAVAQKAAENAVFSMENRKMLVRHHLAGFMHLLWEEAGFICFMLKNVPLVMVDGQQMCALAQQNEV